jgi:hypothetical protein
MEHLFYPSLVFYYEVNPDYGKNFNITYTTHPSREIYDRYLEHCFTLGREPASYEDYCEQYVRETSKTLGIHNSSPYRPRKIPCSSFRDIEIFYENRKDTFYKFVDPKLNEHFGIKVE